MPYRAAPTQEKKACRFILARNFHQAALEYLSLGVFPRWRISAVSRHWSKFARTGVVPHHSNDLTLTNSRPGP